MLRGDEPPRAPAAPSSLPATPQIRIIRGRSGFFERLPPRPPRDQAARAEHIARLRLEYAKPPQNWPAPLIDAGVEWQELGLLPSQPVSALDVPLEPKRQLGRLLFFDPRLSHSGQMACASCHDPDLGWADGRTVSFGTGRLSLPRNAPSIMNSAFQEAFFWDGRASSLEDQAIQVLMNPDEMNSSPEIVIQRLSQLPDYGTAFQEAFGTSEITLDRVSRALAAFERTLIGGRSRFDAFLSGKSAALSDEALSGLDLFRREARCLNCHHGPLLSDKRFHDVGLSYFGRSYEDLGRYRSTGDVADSGKFRTPSLRNITATRPYMHNGLFELENVINLYNAGMPTLVPKPDQENDPRFPKKSPLLKPLGLNPQDVADLRAFLESLEEPRTRFRPPKLPGREASPVDGAAADNFSDPR
ncbi:MAG: cytochrome-c peroxidase [Planctomyces sp.]|nr:cytochrome-c peroxidase [Planctomyces sp.]